MTKGLIKRFSLIIILFTITTLTFAEGFPLDNWQFSPEIDAPASEWKRYFLKGEPRQEQLHLKRGESIFLKTTLPPGEVEEILKEQNRLQLSYRFIEGVTAIYLNGTPIFSSEKPAYLTYTDLPLKLLAAENELVIELKKDYSSPDINPRMASYPKLYTAMTLYKKQLQLLFLYILMAMDFVITGSMLLLFFNKKLKNYEYPLFSLLCLTFAVTTSMEIPAIYSSYYSAAQPVHGLLTILIKMLQNFQPLIGLIMYRFMFKEQSSFIKRAIISLGVWSTTATLITVILELSSIKVGFLHSYIFQLYTVTIFILNIVMIIRAFKRKIPGVSFFLIGLLMFIAASIVEFLGEQGILQESTFYQNAGFFLYICSIGFYLSKQFLTVNLGYYELNQDLNAKVIERTGQLKESYLQKSNFFINMTHETRTPVMLVKNYLELHIKEVGSSPRLDIAYKNACELERNMDNYMQLEKAADREQQLYRHDQTVNLTELLKQIVKLYPEDQLKLCLESELYIKANPAALKRVVDNLLSNALKYNRVDVEITVDLKAEGESLILKIADNGVGIELEQQKHIFTPFYQASTSKMNIQGVGLGLSLVKVLVDSLDGQIELESAPGEGTKFTITLKKAMRPEGEQEELITIPPARLPAGERQVADSSYIASRESLLIIEDKHDTLELLKTLLEQEYNIYVASDGEKGMQRLEELKQSNRLPDLIISDIMMDNIDGYRFISLLKEREEFSYIPVIFLTAKSTGADESRAYNGGAVAYITKPFSPESLKGAVRANIESRESLLDDFEKSRCNLTGFYSRCDDFGLSKIKKEILKQWILEDIPQATIAQNIERKLRTVEKHIKEIKEATGVQEERSAKSALKVLFKEYII